MDHFKKVLLPYKLRFHTTLVPGYVIWLILLSETAIALVRFQWLSALIAIITFVLTLFPFFLQQRFKLSIPNYFVVAIIFFISASLFFGEVSNFYEKFWWWDMLLHSLSALGFGILGFVIMLYLTQSSKLTASPFLIAFFSFCFALAMGTTWELYEFFMDETFGTNMLKSGLVDTMTDLIIDAVGAIIASLSGYFYLRFGPNAVLGLLIHPVLKENMRHFRSKVTILRRFHKGETKIAEHVSMDTRK
jgi:uncharacterized membrane protein YjdF